MRNERPTLLARFGAFLSRHKTRQITCFDCAAVQTVSSSSSSSLCPNCSAYIDLSDFKINTVFSRVIQTQGTVTIGSKADVTSSKVACREAYLKGKLRGNLLCTGTAHIKLKGKITGFLEAGHVAVAKRSEVEFVRTVKARSMEIAGKVSANLQVDGTVKITKRGRLEGTVHAKGIVVEKGGVFQGELIIAPASLNHPALSPRANSVRQQPGKSAPQTSPSSQDAQPDLGLDL